MNDSQDSCSSVFSRNALLGVGTVDDPGAKTLDGLERGSRRRKIKAVPFPAESPCKLPGLPGLPEEAQYETGGMMSNDYGSGNFKGSKFNGKGNGNGSKKKTSKGSRGGGASRKKRSSVKESGVCGAYVTSVINMFDKLTNNCGGRATLKLVDDEDFSSSPGGNENLEIGACDTSYAYHPPCAAFVRVDGKRNDVETRVDGSIAPNERNKRPANLAQRGIEKRGGGVGCEDQSSHREAGRMGRRCHSHDSIIDDVTVTNISQVMIGGSSRHALSQPISNFPQIESSMSTSSLAHVPVLESQYTTLRTSRSVSGVVSALSCTIPRAEVGKGEGGNVNAWSEPHAGCIRVRGPGYLGNGKGRGVKLPSKPALCSIIGVDSVKCKKSSSKVDFCR